MLPLPQSTDAEKAVLSCCLLDPAEAFDTAMTLLRAEHFHLPAHRLLWEVLVALKDAGKPVTPVAVQQWLMDRRQLVEVGGAATVLELIDFVPVSAHVDFYAGVVREKHVLRSVISVCGKLERRAHEQQEDVPALLDDAEREILAIRDGGADAASILTEMRDRVDTAVTTIESLVENPRALDGIPSGYPDLDAMTHGFHGSEMIVIAARPSMGKTSLVMNMVEHVAVDHGVPAGVFSLEMSADQLVQRLICSRARVAMGQLRSGFLTSADMLRLTHAAQQIAEARIYIDDTPSLSIGEFKAKARRLKQRAGVGVIAVDYLQLMRSTTQRAADNRQVEIAEISSGLKAVAKELSIPVLVLAQLNRAVEGRTGESKGRPRLSDLRESGSIEQDADLVALLVRPEYYAEGDEEKAETQGLAELIVAKHRNGPTGTVELTFLAEAMRFESRAKQPPAA